MARLQEMTMNRGNRTLLLLALAAGLVAAVVVFVAVNSGDDEKTATVAEGVTTSPVVVASQNISAGTEITADMLTTAEVPEALLISGAYTETAPLVGQKARVPILSGEQVPASKVGTQARDEGLALVVPRGMRGLGVEIREVTAVGGLTLPGDRVDVYATYIDDDADGVQHVRVYKILDNIEVLSVAQKAQEPAPAATAGAEAPELSTSGQLPDDLDTQPNAGTVTVSVDPGQTRILVCAQESSDRVWLALRSFGEPPAAPESVSLPPECQ